MTTPWYRTPAMLARIAGFLVYVAFAGAAVSTERRPLVIALALVSAVALIWARLIVARSPRLAIAAVAVAVAAGDATLFLGDHTLGWVPTIIAVLFAIGQLPSRPGLWFAAIVAAPTLVILLLRNGAGTAFGIGMGVLGMALVAVQIRDSRQRAEAAERLLASERAAREATTRAEALGERQRLAREIHDILAHTLTAQIVQLEGARLLVTTGAPATAVLARVEQAQRLAREGLDETRRALESLRADVRPLPEVLGALAARSDARFTVTGVPRTIAAEAGLALERTVREALTNTRKHAPGAHTEVALRYVDGGCEVEVVDTGGHGGHPDLAGTGSGYGLAGMRERAELIGGVLAAGPRTDGEGYRVWLRVPA